MKNDLQTYFCYWNHYGVVQVRSVGYKWVWLRHGSSGRFKKIKRSVWDSITSHSSFSTIDETNHRLSVYRRVNNAGISLTKPTRILKSHPTRRFGWEYKTLQELEAELESLQEKVA